MQRKREGKIKIMTRRKIEESHIQNLTKVSGGTSYSVTIPMEYIEAVEVNKIVD